MTLLVTMLTAATAWADTWPEYITDVILVGGTESEVNAAKSAHSDYTFISQDLNAGCGSGSDYIYLGYKTGYRANVNGGYITDIIVIDAEGTNPPSTVTYSGRTYYLCPYDGGSHFEDVKGNLNSNCGGGWNLYLYYTKANIGKQAVSSITVNSTKDGAINCYYTNGNSHETQIDLNRGLSGSSDVYMHLSTATKTNRPSADPVMASGLVYNNDYKQLIKTAATISSGTMYYRIGTSGSFTSTVADVKATAAGSYTVYYYAGSNSYSDASSTHSASVTIGKSANSGVTVSCADIVEGNALNPQLGGTNLSTGAVTYKYCTTQNGTYTATAPTTAGTYYVKATVAADGNCNEFTTAYATFTIRRDWALHNGGDSEADAYVISTTDDLDLLAQRVNSGTNYKDKFFKLGADITYSHTKDWNDATSTEDNFTPIGKSGATFKGHFDGKGFTVSGIRISSSSDYNGLFGYLYDGATVKNVILSDARIMSGSYSGGIAGDCNISTITNCWVKSNVCIGRYSYVGGIAGNLYGGAIIGCRSEATLIAASGSGRQRYGGIAGSLNVSAANVKHCIVAGATVPGTAYRGAVVGRLWLGSLTNNYYINCSVAGVADATNVGCTDDTNLADTNGARHAVTIGAATGVTITPVGTETNYNLSGITAYEGNNGIIYGGQLYAGAGETVRLNIAYTVPDGCTLNGFTDGNGNALADNGDGSYTLTMTGAAATVTPDVYDLWGIASGRDGSTAAKAYRITTPAGLDLLASKVNGGTDYSGTYFELGDDITYDYTGLGDTESNYTAIGGSFNDSMQYFQGHFDGKGHTVSGIRIYRSGTADPDKYQGLFGQIANGEVKNVSLSDACITGDDHTGGIVGLNNYGTIENCHVLSTVTVLGTKDKAHEHGGIVGYNIGGSIIGCTSSADVTAEMSGASYYYGGIAGWNYDGTIRDCLYLGTTLNGTKRVGAIVGDNSVGTVTNSYYTDPAITGKDGYGNALDHAASALGSGTATNCGLAHKVTLGTGVTIGDAATEHGPLTVYGSVVAMGYNDGTSTTIYSTEGSVISLGYTVPEGYTFSGFTATAGTIGGNATDGYTLTMPAADVTVTLTLVPVGSLVSYIDENGTEQTHAAAEIDGSKTNLPGGWYVVNSNVNLTTKLNFTGDTHLILADGKTLSIDASGDSGEKGCYFGLSCKEGEIGNGATYHDLTIYGQAAGTGKVSANHGHPGNATSYAYYAKTITINGGVVEATSSGRGICGSNVIINGGQIILAPSYATITADNITLGWRKPSDYIQSSEFINPSAMGTITITDGKVFTDGTGIYDHTTTTGTLEKLTNKTLHPCLVLTDNASNTDALAEYNGKTIAVALSGRTLLKNGDWNTLCLPFSLTAGQIATSPLAGATIKELLSTSNLDSEGKLTLNFKDANAITAGKPYMVKWTPTTDNLTNPVFNNVTIDNTENNVSFTGGSFKGTYAPLEITDANRDVVLLLATGNKLGYAKTDRTVANGKALGTCRAYFEITGSAHVRSFIMDFGDEQTTGITTTNAEPSTNEGIGWYDLSGRRLQGKPTQKGVYIQNGKKVIIK